MTKITESDLNILKQTFLAKTDGHNPVFADPGVVFNLVEQGFVEINPTIVNDVGHCAIRITDVGEFYLSQATAVFQPAGPINARSPQLVNGYTTGTGFVVPEGQPSTRVRRSDYPFESLELNGYFFVPVSPANPKPWRKLASAVSQRNKSGNAFSPPRYFTTVRAHAGQVFGPITAPADGVYVIRTDQPPKQS
jgi:hypothetical protein